VQQITLRTTQNPIDFKDIFPLIQELNPSLSKAHFERYTAEMLASGNYYLLRAEKDQKLLGLSGYWIATKYYCAKYLEIDNFIVDSKYRNKGIGVALLNHMEAEAKTLGCKTIMLDAYVENFAAHRFYYRHGFKGRGFHHLKEL